MRKERLLPFWNQLERVIPVVQSQEQNNLTFTIVSVETYLGTGQGFLINVNIASDKQFQFVNDEGRIFVRANVVDDEQNQYMSYQTLVASVNHFTFRTRMIIACMPNLSSTCKKLFVNIGSLEWEHTYESNPAIEPISGLWEFVIDI